MGGLGAEEHQVVQGGVFHAPHPPTHPTPPYPPRSPPPQRQTPQLWTPTWPHLAAEDGPAPEHAPPLDLAVLLLPPPPPLLLPAPSRPTQKARPTPQQLTTGSTLCYCRPPSRLCYSRPPRRLRYCRPPRHCRPACCCCRPSSPWSHRSWPASPPAGPPPVRRARQGQAGSGGVRQGQAGPGRASWGQSGPGRARQDQLESGRVS